VHDPSGPFYYVGWGGYVTCFFATLVLVKQRNSPSLRAMKHSHRIRASMISKKPKAKLQKKE
ncbi:hypothetical protein BDZ91DRAFT_717220, partial [Kalaharituber pfeilii]